MSKIFSYIGISFLWLIAWLPLRVLYLLSNFIYFLLYHVLSYRKKVICNNLQKSFPEKNEEEINKIAKKYYRHLSDIFVEVIYMLHMSKKDVAKRCKYKNVELIEKYYKENRSVIAILGHYNNWEWMAYCAATLPHEFYAIYKPLSNKIFDRFFKKMRERHTGKLMSMEDTFRIMVKNYRDRKLTFTGFIGDHTPTMGDAKYWTKFMNQDTPVFLGTEKIAQKLDYVVVFTHMRKIKRGYYEIEFIPITDQAKKTAPYEITEKHVKQLEKIMKDKPEYWLWSHRRWKHKKPAEQSTMNNV